MSVSDQPKSKTLEYDHGVAHVASFKSLVIVFSALLVLTAVTYLISLHNFGEFNLVIALAVAVVKSSLVVLYFMHLRYDKPFNSIVFVGCLIFVGLFIGLALLDKISYHHELDKGQTPTMNKIHTPNVYPEGGKAE
jgi:cytochrome c oxidase subunit 4